ncbi:MAG: hypothetical protein KAJ03_05200 [Gammaproteobacteria bacterium]|nr:hypothetical protein [Gammaproteobacteria bacterium]
MSQTIQDTCDVLRNAVEKLRVAIHTELKMDNIEKSLTKLHDFVYVAHTHRCFSGTQAYCYNDCTIAADPNTREVFHKCIKGYLQQYDVDTAVFYPIGDKAFSMKKSGADMDIDSAKAVFAALDIPWGTRETTPVSRTQSHRCKTGKRMGCATLCTLASYTTCTTVHRRCLRECHGVCLVCFERMEAEQ